MESLSTSSPYYRSICGLRSSLMAPTCGSSLSGLPFDLRLGSWLLNR